MATNPFHGVTVTAFMSPGTQFKLHPPRDYTGSTGATGRTNWIVEITNRLGAYPTFTLHAEDPSVLWELHDLIAATLPPREQNGGGGDA
jgi:hypothetical protein